jgi:hypothetical protein
MPEVQMLAGPVHATSSPYYKPQAPMFMASSQAALSCNRTGMSTKQRDRGLHLTVRIKLWIKHHMATRSFVKMSVIHLQPSCLGLRLHEGPGGVERWQGRNNDGLLR